MSIRSTNILIGNNELDQVGKPARADGYYGYADGMHLVAFYLRNFIGRLHIDATVADKPTEADWFPIGLGQNLTHFDVEESANRIESFNIVGNFVFIRARIERSHLGRPVEELGSVERVVLQL
jgi:hypothetical protein